MADVLRGPLLVGRRDIAPVLAVTAFAMPSLLATVLAVAGAIPLPVGAVSSFPLQQQNPVARKHYLNADTSRGTPRTLRADNQAPVFVAPHFAPSATRIKGWTAVDTSTRSTGKPLTFDDQAPVFVPSHFAPSTTRINGWLPASTASSSAFWLIPTGPLPLPPGAATPTSLLRFFWQPPDSTADTPKALIGDAQQPFAIMQWPAPERTRFAPDTSAKTPKALTADAQLPFSILPAPTPERTRHSGDTTLDSPVVLLQLVALPPPPGVAAPLFAQQFVWQTVNTSAGQTKPLFADARLPVFVAPHFSPSAPRLRHWLPADASRSTAKTLIADAQRPFAGLLPAMRERKRDVLDTTADMAPTLRVVLVAPFVPPMHYAPLRYWWQPASTAIGTAKPLYADVVPVPPGAFGVPVFHGVAYASTRIGTSPDADGSSRIGGSATPGPRRIGRSS